MQNRLPFRHILAGEGRLGDANVEASRAGKDGAAGSIEKGAAVETGQPAVAFGDIERDGSRGAVELVREGNNLGILLDQGLVPSDEFKGSLVNLELFVIEERSLGNKVRIRTKITIN